MITINNTYNFSMLRIEQSKTKQKKAARVYLFYMFYQQEWVYSFEAITMNMYYTHVSPCSPSAVFCNLKVITCSMKPYLKTHLLKVSVWESYFHNLIK